MLNVALLLSMAAWSADPATLVVVEKKAGQVGFYSPDGKRLSGTRVGTHPHEIVMSPDKKTAYVSDNGILWMQYAGEGGNTISIIDLVRKAKTGEINLGQYRRPHGMALDPKNNRLVCTIENPDGLLLIDLNTRKVVRKFDIKGEDPHMVLFGPDYHTAYVSNTTTNTIAAVNLATGAVKLIPTDKRPQGGVLSNDGKLIYMTNSDGNSISIIEVAKNERVGTIATGKGPNRIVMTPDGKTLVYSMQAGQSVGFADVASRKEMKTISLGGDPLSLTMSADGKRAYSGVQDQDKIFVISIAERKIERIITTPKEAGPDPVLPISENVGSRPFQLAGLSLTPEAWNKEANLAKLDRFAREAAGKGAEVIVAPEGFLEGYVGNEKRTPDLTRERYQSVGEEIHGPLLKRVSRLALELKVYLLVGFAERRQGKMYNSAVIFSPEGAVASHYSKSHTAADEPFNTKGTEFPVVPTVLGRWGTLICFDRQLPETSRILALKGAQLILVPAWGSYGEMNDQMMRVRAYENGVWVAFVHPKRTLIIDPKGKVVASNQGETDQVVMARVDPDLAGKSSLIRERRPELYGDILRR